MKNPCYTNGVDCTRRTAGCHATCLDGLAADKAHREHAERINAIKASERVSAEFTFSGIDKRKRRERNMKSYSVKL